MRASSWLPWARCVSPLMRSTHARVDAGSVVPSSCWKIGAGSASEGASTAARARRNSRGWARVERRALSPATTFCASGPLPFPSSASASPASPQSRSFAMRWLR